MNGPFPAALHSRTVRSLPAALHSWTVTFQPRHIRRRPAESGAPGPSLRRSHERSPSSIRHQNLAAGVGGSRSGRPVPTVAGEDGCTRHRSVAGHATGRCGYCPRSRGRRTAAPGGTYPFSDIRVPRDGSSPRASAVRVRDARTSSPVTGRTRTSRAARNRVTRPDSFDGLKGETPLGSDCERRGAGRPSRSSRSPVPVRRTGGRSADRSRRYSFGASGRRRSRGRAADRVEVRPARRNRTPATPSLRCP